MGQSIKIHALSTGQVQVKRSAMHANGQGAMRIVQALRDPNWTDWLPIHVWVIEHPEGIIVVDSGEQSRTRPSPLARFRVRPEDEIGAQLQRLNIEKSDIRCVVQTHLHGDHVHGLDFFSGLPVLVSAREWQDQQGLGGWFNRRISGMRLPAGFQPQLVTFEPVATSPFEHVQHLTKDGAVMLVPTPGHTLGHLSVVVQHQGVCYFLAGDTSFSQAQLLTRSPSGLSADARLETQTHERILRFARLHPTVYLPSHDPESVKRLELGQTIV